MKPALVYLQDLITVCNVARGTRANQARETWMQKWDCKVGQANEQEFLWNVCSTSDLAITVVITVQTQGWPNFNGPTTFLSFGGVLADVLYSILSLLLPAPLADALHLSSPLVCSYTDRGECWRCSCKSHTPWSTFPYRNVRLFSHLVEWLCYHIERAESIHQQVAVNQSRL